MNDKIRRFTTQLSEAAPLAPELEGRTIPTSRSPLTSSPITALRVGVAIAAVGVLGLVAVIVSANEDRGAVIPASGQTSAAISDAIQAVLPDGFRLELVERRDSPDATPSPASVPAHAVAVNDRLEVLDIEFMALGQVVEDTQPDEISPDTEPTENASSDDLVTNTTVTCITTTSVQGAVECLEYADEGTAVTLSPPDTSVSGAQPQCYTFGNPQESSSASTIAPCSLEELGSQEIAKSNQCTVYVGSAPDVPPVIPGCPQVTVIIDPSLPDSTIPVAGTSPGGTGSVVTETTVPGDGSSNIEEGTSPVFDPFGVDPSGTPSPFQGASTRTANVLVTVAHYAINQGVDVAALSSAVASSLEQIPNLAAAIDTLPKTSAPVDMFVTAPTDGSFSGGAWSGGGVISGSLSVSLSKRASDGTVIVGITFSGSLEASGNDGDVFWHGTTDTDVDGGGRVSIVLMQRGDRSQLSDADAAAMVRKIAEANVIVTMDTIDGSADPSMITPATSQPPATEAPTETPVETTVLSAP